MGGTGNFFWRASDGKELYVHCWSQGRPRGLLVVVHGVAEHGLRYAALAMALVERGWSVWAPDHRGHGQTEQTSGPYGSYAEQDGFLRVVEDLRGLVDLGEGLYPGVPICLLGHCMGTLITQAFLGRYGTRIAASLWLGIIEEPKPVQVAAGKLLVALGSLLYGQLAQARFLDRLIIGEKNRSFEPARTAFDWLSRDPEEVDRYNADPLCGFLCSYGFFRDLIFGLETVYGQAGLLSSIPPSLPIYILAGDSDPVGGARGAVGRLAKRLEDEGFHRIDVRLYAGARHEILHETNRNEVIADVVEWLGKWVEERCPARDRIVGAI